MIDDALLSVQACSTVTHDEYSVVDQVIAALVLGGLSVLLQVLLPVTAFAIFTDIDAAINPPHGSPEAGVGCKLWQALPSEIALPATGGLAAPVESAIAIAKRGGRRRLATAGVVVIGPKKEKLVIAYSTPTVDSRGLFAGALASRQDRVPAAHIAGPASLAMFSTPHRRRPSTRPCRTTSSAR